MGPRFVALDRGINRLGELRRPTRAGIGLVNWWLMSKSATEKSV
jgi:hypothetical protein